ncbi:50S ribosomal protein L21 [Candidatus Methylacidiphilum fumarolicum]|uniref:Large ribosomal subunit protein bL21 n=2 Tax=Candidatus Methylacidiphilum fumarolicum TaxID=591154 RepID=I0JYW4_METFB|nr:50S ribosomal protein L21 [Candidatus Methylacidiphilum fumarolicum]MBW6415960.1 50S ribosomal protein L21 [Candidatus Methylacidiphilum fumarolicum]TFE68879.1 50S ribosomal protein L21 [Candidatus Methylacidiphilum fumarolicum]TFE71500.1 50S ribosomal protein L21 [Candidatus Methylacidiphilum fumarolicum]TFE71600.1 50S ribosomal protein L21 [Candidatus Methylacidiphilum fumarolicum]TFE76234.1 50S ribosomal protein L21 [Candidatus Methylacidiphilum fumarolicum]
MKAIIQTGGKQYWVSEGEQLSIELPSQQPTQENTIKIEEVLYVEDGQTKHVGTSFVPGAAVELECISEIKAPKVVAFKFRRRKGYHRTVGHRQKLLLVKVKKIHYPADNQ